MTSLATPTRTTRPSLLLLSTEPWRAAAEYVAHRLHRTGREPQHRADALAAGDGHPVIVFPGLASDGNAVAPLVRHCRNLGHAAMDWGRGFNTGPGKDVDAWLQELAHEMTETLRALKLRGVRGAPTLIGWSLGGIYARELARLPGFAVRQVITIGTPFSGHPAQTHASKLYELLSGSSADMSSPLLDRFKRPPPVPTTSIYSRSDGVVAWQACRHDCEGPRVQDIEIEGSHLGMGWNRAVLDVVGDRLAQPARQWRPYASRPARVAPAGVVARLRRIASR